MKKRYLFLIPLFAILLVGVFVIGFSMSDKPIPSDSLGTTLEYNSMVTIQTTGDFEGRQTPLGEWEVVSKNHNVLYDTGKEGIEALVGAGGASDAFDWIELCNSSTSSCGEPTAGKTEAYSAHTTCGLSKVAGTQGTTSAESGNWTVYNSFTSSCDNTETNVSRLQNAVGDDLAGANYSNVNLMNGDKLNLTWVIWVT